MFGSVAVLVGVMFMVGSDQSNSGEGQLMQGRNRLQWEKSPYLLQHQDNPVAWYAWGDAAFAAAREHHKPIFLSIGYSTCHWCHVMEHDSFERDDVAQILNEHFISIKVDREERPDVDQIYMDAVVAMTGRGGWPLTVFLTPDLKPFYGGTFFWRPQFMRLLGGVGEAWQRDPSQILAQGTKLFEALKQQGSAATGEAEVSLEILKKAATQARERFDATHGGFGDAPKFPPHQGLRALLRIARRTGDTQVLTMVTTTLDAMASGGIYDHLGGGFHRYATDGEWLVPHFEKMLYDNAQLAVAYLEAYQLTKETVYAQIARETLDYILRDMTAGGGGFYSAEDADSEGEEGKFYVWQNTTLRQSLSVEEFSSLSTLYQTSDAGNFEHETNILHLAQIDDWATKADPHIQSAHHKLFALREARMHPYKDDKILTAWNGLMMSAMALGARVLEDGRYLAAAQASARFLQQQLVSRQGLLRRYRDGEAKISAVLNDYAYLIAGLIDLHQADSDAQWIVWAEQLQREQDTRLWDPTGKAYFFAGAASTDLLVRNKELHDGAIPSGNGVAALNLQRLFALTFAPDYHEKSTGLLKTLSAGAQRYPWGFGSALVAADFALDRSYELAIIGRPDEAAVHEMRAQLTQAFHPHLVVAVGTDAALPILKDRPQIEGKPTYYLCEKMLCKAPTTDPATVLSQLRAIERYSL